jgi:hypothetical protein
MAPFGMVASFDLGREWIWSDDRAGGFACLPGQR